MENKLKVLIAPYANKNYWLVDKAIEFLKNDKRLCVSVIPQEELKTPENIPFLSNNNEFEVLVVTNGDAHVTDHVIKQIKGLKWVQVLGTGVEKLLKFDSVLNKDITLTNLKSVSAIELAEFAMLGVLYFMKKIPLFNELKDKKEWMPVQDTPFDLHLYNKKAVVIGLGEIGSEIARKCHYGFSMNVIGVKRNPATVCANMNVCCKEIVKPDNLKETVKDADFVFAALPFNKTGYVVTEEVLMNMKKGSIFVNVGRGTTVDEKGLIKALKADIIRAAALDVFEVEPLPKDSPFYTDPSLKDRVLNTCHKMDQGIINLQVTYDFLSKNIELYLSDKQLENIVDKEKGY